MGLRTAVLLALIVGSSVAIADDEGSFYGIALWQSPTGMGHAIVYGPVSEQQCTAAQQRIYHESAPPTVSPDMQLRAGLCAKQPQLANILVPNGCSSSVPFDVPQMPRVRGWFYSCFRAGY
jgi:hypothetical protein